MVTPEQLEALRMAVEENEKARIINMCGRLNGNERTYPATVKPGRLYIKVDVGTSGRYMIETTTGMVYGIKAYGVVHRRHCYGTVEQFTTRLTNQDTPALYRSRIYQKNRSLYRITEAITI